VKLGGLTKTPVMEATLRVRKKLAMEVTLRMRNMLARIVLRMVKSQTKHPKDVPMKNPRQWPGLIVVSWR